MGQLDTSVASTHRIGLTQSLGGCREPVSDDEAKQDGDGGTIPLGEGKGGLCPPVLYLDALIKKSEFMSSRMSFF